MEVHKLFKPFEFDGEKITEIQMDLENLAQRDLAKAEREARARTPKKEFMGMLEFNRKYLASVAAIAGGLPVDAMFELGAKDYTQICLLVQNFLLDGESDESEAEDETKPSGKTSTSTTTNTPPNSNPPTPTSGNSTKP